MSLFWVPLRTKTKESSAILNILKIVSKLNDESELNLEELSFLIEFNRRKQMKSIRRRHFSFSFGLMFFIPLTNFYRDTLYGFVGCTWIGMKKIDKKINEFDYNFDHFVIYFVLIVDRIRFSICEHKCTSMNIKLSFIALFSPAILTENVASKHSIRTEINDFNQLLISQSRLWN